MDLLYPPSPLTEFTLSELRGRRSMKWHTYSTDVLPLWVAEMDTPLAPPVRDALSAAVLAGDTGYAHKGELPQAYAEFALARYGCVVDPDACAIVPDVMGGVVAVLERLTSPGDGVVVNTPVYPPFFAYLRMAARRIVESPLGVDADGAYFLDLDRLEADFATPEVTAYLMCNPHNPTGLVVARDDLVAVATMAERHGVRVLVDEIHAPLVYPSNVFVPFLSLADEAAAAATGFTFTSASKAWNLAGLKAALVVAGPEATPVPADLPIELTDVATGIFGVIASEVAFRAGGPWLDSVLVGLDANRMLLGRLLAEGLPEVRYRPPDSTYLAWLDCRELGLGDDPAETFLDRGRVALSAGPRFGAPGRGFARLNFATGPEILAEGVTRMVAAVMLARGR